MNKKGMKKKVISLVLTLGIITMLILSGPVSAVQVQITNFTSTTPNESSTVSFLVQVDIEAGERIPVQNLTLTLTNAAGLSNYNCTFDTAGTTLTTCSGISINVLNALNYSTGTNYGYGYGYDYSNGVTDYSNATFYGGNSGYGYGYTSGYGYSASPYSELAYNITWTTPAVTANTAYSISFSALADDGAGKKRTYQTSSSSTVTVQNVVETVPPSGGGSSSGGTTAA
ncbi:MAG: hypothetical protein L6408_08065, partial [Nanoarchaeota archaeon]|nr:hypothetical protein [Nanoarchaeota archaeon]